MCHTVVHTCCGQQIKLDCVTIDAMYCTDSGKMPGMQFMHLPLNCCALLETSSQLLYMVLSNLFSRCQAHARVEGSLFQNIL